MTLTKEKLLESQWEIPSKWIDNKWGRKRHLSEEKQVLERTRVSWSAD